MFKVAVLISGNGTDLQSILDGVQSGYLNIDICAVISDKKDAYGLTRAKERGIPTYAVDRKNKAESVSDQILEIIEGKADLVVLAGFLSILSEKFVSKFENRIINIHPSLIPSFCGNGMYGMNVHRKAIEYGVKVSGCTVHFVDTGTDTGPIILQKVVPVFFEDTPEILQKRILEKEHQALPEAIKLISEGKISIHGRKVMVCK